jgi:hypothetical protein
MSVSTPPRPSFLKRRAIPQNKRWDENSSLLTGNLRELNHSKITKG